MFKLAIMCFAKASLPTSVVMMRVSCQLKSAFSELGSKTFSSNVRSSLMILLGNYGCRQIPTPDSIKAIVTSVAKHTFLFKPLACLYSMHGGIAAEHKVFWKDVSVEHGLQCTKSDKRTCCAGTTARNYLWLSSSLTHL